VANLAHPVTLGVAIGLVAGKPIGVLVFVAIGTALRLASLPDGVTWSRLIGAAFACGIGFTMSLFIAGLAFEHGSGDYFSGDRLGVLLGSVMSALIAFVVLHISLPRGRETSRQ
jgi:NhaA family Na+:H+ antiporter